MRRKNEKQEEQQQQQQQEDDDNEEKMYLHTQDGLAHTVGVKQRDIPFNFPSFIAFHFHSIFVALYLPYSFPLTLSLCRLHFCCCLFFLLFISLFFRRK